MSPDESAFIAVARLEGKLDTLVSEVKKMNERTDKCFTDHECRIREVEIHGSQKTREVEAHLETLHEKHDKLQRSVEYERGRLAVIFVTIGAAVSAGISILMDIFSGGSG